MTGFFKLVDGQGVHLTDVVQHFHGNDLIPDWIDFLQNTIDSNWNLRSTIEKISIACFEVYGPKHRDVVIDKIKLWIIKKYGE